MIPKIIFQTHEPDYDNLPSHVKEISGTWKVLNPNYKYVYMNSIQRKQYVVDNYPNLIKLYENVDKPYQADIWRYAITYDNGGVYADMDSICLFSLDNFWKNLYNDQEVICTDIGLYLNENIINNANFAVKKNSIILKNILDDLDLIGKSNRLFFGPEIFQKHLFKNRDKVLFAMSMACAHGESFKHGLERLGNKESYIVNYLGDFTTYSKVLENNKNDS